jgi:hypothetical protein
LATTSCTTKAKSDTSDARSDKGAELLVQLEAKEAADVAKNGRPGFVNAWAEDGVELVDGGGINSKDEMSKETLAPKARRLPGRPFMPNWPRPAISGTRTGLGCTAPKIKRAKLRLLTASSRRSGKNRKTGNGR